MPTGTVDITVTKLGNAYQVTVDPWLVRPAGSQRLTRIEWTFTAVNTSFAEAKLDFATKNHFHDARNVASPGSKTAHYILDDAPNPVPSGGGMLGSDIINPAGKNLPEYEYIIELIIQNGPQIEIDPGYRVRP